MSSRTVLDVNLTSFTLREVPYLLVARKDSQIWREQITLSGLHNTAVLFQQDITPDLLDVVKIVSKSENKLRIKYAPDTATLSLWLEAGIGVTICNQNGIVCTSNTRPLKHIELKELGFAKMVLLWNKNYNGILLESFWRVVKHL